MNSTYEEDGFPPGGSLLLFHRHLSNKQVAYRLPRHEAVVVQKILQAHYFVVHNTFLFERYAPYTSISYCGLRGAYYGGKCILNVTQDLLPAEAEVPFSHRGYLTNLPVGKSRSIVV